MTDDDVPAASTNESRVADEDLKWPAGFITVVVLAVFYLGWRLIQLTARLIDWNS